MLLYQILAFCYEWKNINNKFKISAPTWNEESELPDIIFCIKYSRLFWIYLKKKRDTVADNPSTIIYVKKIKNRITFQIKTGCHLELLTPETINFFGSTKVNKDKNCKNLYYWSSINTL